MHFMFTVFLLCFRRLVIVALLSGEVYRLQLDYLFSILLQNNSVPVTWTEALSLARRPAPPVRKLFVGSTLNQFDGVALLPSNTSSPWREQLSLGHGHRPGEPRSYALSFVYHSTPC